MNIKSIFKVHLLILTMLIPLQKVSATEVVTTEHLTIYYPTYSSIDLSLGKMPVLGDAKVEFSCEAAFTGQLLNSFSHTNIADHHVSGGKFYKGYSCRANTGAFIWGNGKWSFMKKAEFLSKKPNCQMAFCQYLIILNGKQTPMWKMMRNNRTIYRALCEKDGRLCLVQSKKVITLTQFVKYLMDSHITNAIYLDMGKGWNYAWYRNEKGKVQEIFPESKKASDYKYRTNWITFFK